MGFKGTTPYHMASGPEVCPAQKCHGLRGPVFHPQGMREHNDLREFVDLGHAVSSEGSYAPQLCQDSLTFLPKKEQVAALSTFQGPSLPLGC